MLRPLLGAGAGRRCVRRLVCQRRPGPQAAYLVHLPAGNQKRRARAYPLDIVPDRGRGGRRFRLGRRPHVAKRRSTAGRSGRRARNGKDTLPRLGADPLHRLRLRPGVGRELGEVDALPDRPPVQAAAQESPGFGFPRHATRAHRRNVWVRVEGHKGDDPQDRSSLADQGAPLGRSTGHPRVPENVWANGVLWRYDSPNGTVVREAEQNGPEQAIRVTRVTPTQGGPCLSSITIAGGSVWVTAAPLTTSGDSFICQR